MEENLTQSDNDSLCAQYETYSLARFICIMVATMVASAGTAGNIILIHLFCGHKTTTPPTLYPTVLAILDFLICFEYILLFGIDGIVSYLKIKSLFILYYFYIIPAYVASRITQLAIPYMLIFATLERYIWTCGNVKNKYVRAFCSTTGRHWTVIVSLSICTWVRLPTAFAMTVADYPLCKEFFRTMTTQPREWAMESAAYHVFDFHIMTIAQMIVPFVILLTLNSIIVRKMNGGLAVEGPAVLPLLSDESPQTRKISSLNLALQPLKGMSGPMRSAVFTMVTIVASYLISNVLHVILTIMERSDHPLLKDAEDPLLSSTFHTYFSDAVSFVYMFTSAIRIVIYYGCNPMIREELQNKLFDPKPIMV